MSQLHLCVAPGSGTDDEHERQTQSAPAEPRRAASQLLRSQVTTAARSVGESARYTNPLTCLLLTSASCRREVYSAPALAGLSSDSDRERDEDGGENEDSNDPEDNSPNSSTDSSHSEEDTGMV